MEGELLFNKCRRTQLQCLLLRFFSAGSRQNHHRRLYWHTDVHDYDGGVEDFYGLSTSEPGRSMLLLEIFGG